MLLTADRQRRDRSQERLKISYDVWKKSFGPHSEQPQEKHGLTYYAPAGPRAEAFYVQENNGKLISFISCTSFDNYPNPGCNHVFAHNDLTVQLTYRLSLLTRWKEIEDNTRKFLADMTLGRVSTRKPICDELGY